MSFYSGCNLLVKVPPKYSKKGELIRFPESKLEGCEIKVEESETEQPFAQSDEVSENSELSGLEVGKEWTTPGRPTPLENDTGPHLLRAAQEAIEEFIAKSKHRRSTANSTGRLSGLRPKPCCFHVELVIMCSIIL
jgi:hypothetical protein